MKCSIFHKKVDFVVVGSGIAGLTTALMLTDYGEVLLLTKQALYDSNSFKAQGGIAAAISADDSPDLHGEDTKRTGAGLCDPEAVDTLVKMGPAAVEWLMAVGTVFDGEQQIVLTKEGSHSRSRILHSGGDATGAAILMALASQVNKNNRIEVLTHCQVVDLNVANGECHGISAIDANGHLFTVTASGTVLASGGCGQVFRYTTNAPVITGDGYAMARRAGVRLRDMEFVQFHPTALAVRQNPMFLISEAVRGEGAVLVNDRGEQFMERAHSWADLAPRDVVAREIDAQMRSGRKVYLDATSIEDGFDERFPTIAQTCRKHGINPSKALIPVTPAAHFMMGGIETDLHGETNLPRLFACGEVACTGVHGANRLASNSLLEGVVFAHRTAAKMGGYSPLSGYGKYLDKRPQVETVTCSRTEAELKLKLQETMWEHAGIIRTKHSLKDGLRKIRTLANQLSYDAWELRNMVTVSEAILQAALWRRESRGGHYRLDFPQEKSGWTRRHLVT